MNISEITFTPIKPIDGLIGFASLVIESNIYLGSIGVYSKRDGTGYRIAYPTKKIGTRNINLYHPINKESGEIIEDAIISRVNEILAK